MGNYKHDAPKRETQSMSKMMGIVSSTQCDNHPSEGQYDSVFHTNEDCSRNNCLVCAHEEISDQCNIKHCGFCQKLAGLPREQKSNVCDLVYPTKEEVFAQP